MSYQLISLDMDGTLLDNNLKISDENRNTIHQATLQNKYVVIATGRSLTEMSPYMKALEDIRYFILESGAVIYDRWKDQIIDRKCFLPEDVEKIIRISYKQDVMPHYFTGGYSYSFTEKMMHMDKYNMAKLQDFYLENVRKIIDFDEFIRKNKKKIEKIILYHQSMKELEICHHYLEDINIEKPDVGISIELSPYGVNKASALERLCHMLNIPVEQTIAVGDSDNDLEILNMAGLAIAMENGNENVKKLCDIVVLDNDHHGVAKAIQTYLCDDESYHK